MFYVYVLSSIRYRKSYVGSTDDLERRLLEHNSGKMSFSRRYKPWILFYSENYKTLSEARKREIYLKSGAGRRFLKELFENQ